MTKVNVYKKDGNILRLSAEGHSKLKKNEKYDLICCAISSILQTSILGLIKYIDKESFIYEINDKKPYLNIQIKDTISISDLNKSNVILDTAIEGIKNLSMTYPRFIQLEDM